jgi:hypothetical protein
MSLVRFAAVVVIGVTTASACRGQDTQAAGDAASGAAAALPLPAEVQIPPVVCKLKTELFRPLGDYPVRASGVMAPYLRVGTTATPPSGRIDLRGDLGLPSDEDLPFSLRLVGGGVELRGLVERSFPIHAAGPLALGAFAAALPHTELRVLKANALEVEVEAQLGDSVEILSGPPRTRGPCALFAIERRDFMASSVIPGVKWKNEPDAMLKRGRKIPLTTLPIGAPVARIEVRGNDNPAVAVFEKEKDRAHIGWFGSTVMIHGWIAASDLDPLPKSATKGADAGVRDAAPADASASDASSATTKDAAAAKPALEHLACAEPVPLVATNGDSRSTVGSLRPGGSFDVLSRDRGWAEIRVSVHLVAVTDATRLLVRETDLASCTPAPR